MKRLFALVVGIDAYPTSPLSGCVHDADRMAAYLEGPLVEREFEVSLVNLRNGEATKDGIVSQFREHLGQAGEGDTALLFFAGHGYREQTTIPAFKNAELDGKIANLVCVDSAVRGGSAEHTFLADKELRFLIHELSQKGPEIITIFDCCHSGDNTRDVGSAAADGLGTPREISSGAARARPWEGFVFHEEIDPKALESMDLDEVLPEGPHVQLAACRDVEKAYEFQGKGAFTTALLDTLQSHDGVIQYHDLFTRVRNRMRKRGTGDRPLRGIQTPQIYVQTGNPADRFRRFLTHAKDDVPTWASVSYNAAEQEWRLGIGALHGVPVDPSEGQASVAVFDRAHPETSIEASLAKVLPGYAVIRPAEELKEDRTYRAHVHGTAVRPLSIFVRGDDARLIEEALRKRLEEASLPYIALVDCEESADYVLDVHEGVLTTKSPHAPQALLSPVRYSDGEHKFDLVYADLIQMARWTFLKDLERRPAGVGTFPLELRVFHLAYQDGEEVEREVPPKGNSLTLHPEPRFRDERQAFRRDQTTLLSDTNGTEEYF